MTSPVLKPLKCSRCGAALTVRDDQRVVTCSYCQQSHLFVPPPPAEPEGTGFEVGDEVAVEWQDRWWPATVSRVEGRQAWLIHYDGWSHDHDEIVGPARIRHRSVAPAVPSSAGQTAVRQRPSGGLAWLWWVGLVVGVAVLVAVFAFRSAATDHQPPSQEKGDVNRTYERGERVQIYWGNRWWDGRIVEVVGSGQYRISYDGWDSEWDETVDASRLRPSPAR